MVNRELAKRTIIVVVDLKNKAEYVLKNPSEKRVSAVYIDESIMMLGCHDEVFQLTPRNLFL